ncbi:Hypothetical predicted protein, partial [Olea europaea subsp. europaea]
SSQVEASCQGSRDHRLALLDGVPDVIEFLVNVRGAAYAHQNGSALGFQPPLDQRVGGVGQEDSTQGEHDCRHACGAAVAHCSSWHACCIESCMAQRVGVATYRRSALSEHSGMPAPCPLSHSGLGVSRSGGAKRSSKPCSCWHAGCLENFLDQRVGVSGRRNSPR